MRTSCGIIIVNEHNQIFTGHPTGNNFFDLPKGLLEDGEEPKDCAIRECFEETSIQFKPKELKDLGVFSYNKEKKLHLFLAFVKKKQLDLPSLFCISTFEHPTSKKILPEMDYFQWVNFEDVENKFAKSMQKVLTKLINDSIIYFPSS